MGAYYDEVEIEDIAWDEEKRMYHYPCPCGDRFEISRKQLKDYEDIATCPSCSLIIRVVYDPMSQGASAEDQSEESAEESEEETFADAMEHVTIADEKPHAIAAAA